MTKVFLGGSRRVSRLNKDVERRLDNIIDKGFAVVVGDANGADKAMQEYLCSRHYQDVMVFCMEGFCRNNLGNWLTQNVKAPDSTRRDFAYYSTKDRAMANEADYGFMLWDGRSRGTLSNMVDLVRQGKTVLVYVAPTKSFSTLQRFDHLSDLVRRFDPSALGQIEAAAQAPMIGGSSHHKDEFAPLF